MSRFLNLDPESTNIRSSRRCQGRLGPVLFTRRHGPKIRPRIRQRLLLLALCVRLLLLLRVDPRLRPHVLVQIERPRVRLHNVPILRLHRLSPRLVLCLVHHGVAGHLEDFAVEVGPRRVVELDGAAILRVRHGCRAKGGAMRMRSFVYLFSFFPLLLFLTSPASIVCCLFVYMS